MKLLLLWYMEVQVKVLYVRNLMLSTTEVHILETFSAFGVVERVKKIKDYAFIHFQCREDAHKAMNAINGEQEISLHSSYPVLQNAENSAPQCKHCGLLSCPCRVCVGWCPG